MSTWVSGIRAITLFVEDLVQSKTFYQQVFDLSPVHEDDDSAAFDIGNTIVNLLKTTAAPELVAPATVGEPNSGSRAVFTITVDDVDAICADLVSRGVTLLNGPIDRPWGLRTASFRDPSGHIWEITKW